MTCKLVDVATTTELDPGKITYPNIEIRNIQFTYTDTVDLTIDSIIVNVGDLVLLKNQSDATVNGIYEIISKQTVGADIIYVFRRPNDCLFMKIGDYVFTQLGTLNRCVAFILSITDEVLTIGVSDLTFNPVKPIADSTSKLATYPLLTFGLNASSTSFVTLVYFPWINSLYSIYNNGRINMRIVIADRDFEFQLRDTTNGVNIASGTVSSTSFVSLPVINPTTDAQVEFQIRKSAAGGTNPLIFGVILEFET